MKKFILLALLAITTSACSSINNSEDVTASYDVPKEIRDCKIYEVTSNNLLRKRLYVVRCPDSTSTQEK